MKYKTDWISQGDVKREWFIVDAKDQILGRLASRVAKLLIGKNKTTYVPNIDNGDCVVVINSTDIKLTRGKEQKKMYYRHSGYIGGLTAIRFDQQMKKNPNFVIEEAVKNMLPNNKLRDPRMARLFVYSGAEHKQEAQKPKEYKF